MAEDGEWTIPFEDKKIAATYVRRPELQPPGPIEYNPEKWVKLDQACNETPDATILIVAFPEVLGDTYDELLVNLGKLAASGKLLAIAKPSPNLKLQSEEVGDND